jgi:methionine synthase II (cobalamin-independent)
MHLSPPFRADHIGSLKRPKYLLQTRQELDDGKATAADLKQVEDQAIDNIVKMQREVGIKSITDGEFRRSVIWLCLGSTCFMTPVCWQAYVL